MPGEGGRDRSEIEADRNTSCGDAFASNDLLVLEVLLDIRDYQKKIRDYLKTIADV